MMTAKHTVHNKMASGLERLKFGRVRRRWSGLSRFLALLRGGGGRGSGSGRRRLGGLRDRRLPRRRALAVREAAWLVLEVLGLRRGLLVDLALPGWSNTAKLGILRAALSRSSCFSAASEARGLSSRVRRAAPRLQMQSEETVVASRRPAKTAILTMLAAPCTGAHRSRGRRWPRRRPRRRPPPRPARWRVPVTPCSAGCAAATHGT